MPTVNGKKYPYTIKGMRAARAAKKKAATKKVVKKKTNTRTRR